ncbi:FAD binding domain-containing protein [Herbiconiux solani]|uniref:FAD binding domain-containing protein n=1 Tax=Herbiconiux solani TaxID=661329 RepID=UPI0009FF9C13|nr:xanthine dehydrogenase family protein subunit M [Herbiconiux solani]
MKTFDYLRPADAREAVAALAAHPEARLLSGGTNLVDLMKLGVERPELVVDVNRVDFGGIEAQPDGGLLIGAGVRNSELAADLLVRTRYPVVARALLSAASGQLRNMASTGGNLLQRTRCTYFMDTTKPCNKREPGTGCPAHAGLSRELGILGVSDACIATHPGDFAVALAALDAEIRFETSDGPGSLPIEEFYRLPGEHPERDTTLPAGAVITGVRIPGLPYGAVSTYRKARDRRSYAFGLATVAAAIDVEDGRVRDVRIALGGVAHKPWRARRAEELLIGGAAMREQFERAAAAELAQATPTEQNAFKVGLAERLIVGVLTELTELRDETEPPESTDTTAPTGPTTGDDA